jgi:hypothetical protein
VVEATKKIKEILIGATLVEHGTLEHRKTECRRPYIHVRVSLDLLQSAVRGRS